jgi:hypothetical protein
MTELLLQASYIVDIDNGNVIDNVPDPDLHVFGPPGSASGIYLYRSGSGSFHQQAKYEEKP